MKSKTNKKAGESLAFAAAILLAVSGANAETWWEGDAYADDGWTYWSESGNWYNGLSSPAHFVNRNFAEGRSRVVAFGDSEEFTGNLVFGNDQEEGYGAGPVVFISDSDASGLVCNGTYYVGASDGDGSLVISNGTHIATSFEIGQGGKTGVVEVAGGDVRTTGNLILGSGTSGNGALKVSGGYMYVGGELMVANAESAIASVVVTNATLEVQKWVCIGRDGANRKATLTVQDGGVFRHLANNYCVIGNFANDGSENELIVNDGGLVESYTDIYVGENGSATLTVNGGMVRAQAENGGEKWIYMNKNNKAASATTIALNGGVLETGRIVKGSGAAGAITFNGGTLRALVSSTLIAASETLSVTVKEKGGTIDTNGKNITIAQAIGGTGTLSITGGGNVTFSAVPTCPLYIEEGVVELPVGATGENIIFGKNGFVKFDLSGVSATTGETPEETILPQSQTLLTGATIILSDGDTIEEHVIIKNDGSLNWKAAFADGALTATPQTGVTPDVSVWVGGHTSDYSPVVKTFKERWETAGNWTEGVPGADTKVVFPVAAEVVLGESGAHVCGDMVLAAKGETRIYCKQQNINNSFAPKSISGNGSLRFGGMGLDTSSASRPCTVDVPVIAEYDPHYTGSGAYDNYYITYVMGTADCPVTFNRSLTVEAENSCRIEANVALHGDILADGYLTFNHNQTLRGAIAGSGTISGSFTTAEGAVLKSTASADGGVYSATCLTVEGSADLSNATVEIEGGEALADAGSSTEIILLKATGTITGPGSVKYVIPGQKYVWTITTGTATVDETTYNTLKAVRTAYGFMVIIAGETEATVEDQEFGEWVDKVDYTPASGYFSEKNGNGLSPIVAYMLGYPTYDDESAATLAATQNPDGFTLNFVAKGEANNVNGYALQMSIEQSSDLETWTVVDGTTSQGTSAKLLLASVGSAPYFRLTADLVAASTSQE